MANWLEITVMANGHSFERSLGFKVYSLLQRTSTQQLSNIAIWAEPVWLNFVSMFRIPRGSPVAVSIFILIISVQCIMNIH